MDWGTAGTVPSSLPVPEELDVLVRPGRFVLDVGCGEALLGDAVRDRDGRYVGVDVNLPSLRRAASRYAVAASDAAALPFREGAFGVVLLRAVLTVLARDPAMTDAPHSALAGAAPPAVASPELSASPSSDPPAGSSSDSLTVPIAVLREALRVCGGSILVQDFLKTPEHPLYAARYDEGVALGAPRGVFPVREGGAILYWARHYVRKEMETIIGRAGGLIASWREFPAPTRSGNVIRGVVLTAVKA